MKTPTKLLSLLLAVPLVLAAAGCGTNPAPAGDTGGNASNPQDKEVVKIGISQIVEHPSLNATREGFLAALKDGGFTDKDNLQVDYQNAQGDATTNLTIAQKFAADKKDLVVAIATQSAQAVVQNVKDAPVLFAAVTDPVSAKLVASLDKPGANVTGAADTHPDAIPMLMDFIAAEFPNVKTIGIVVNEGEPNSAFMLQTAEAALAKHNIKIVKAAVANSSEVKQAAESLAGRVDAFYITLDNTVVSAVETIIKIANDKKIPFFSSDRDTVEKGAIATYGFKYYDHGYQAGKMAVEILKNGTKPEDMTVTYPDKLDLIINADAAKAQGVEITDSMKSKMQNKENLINGSAK
ncbi:MULTISPECIES: ABC transporter substrate-binding protein [unclassified Paenibacillus]|uniref:ABC transporter substrate-binding protein n=1 Tax=unclassified Paenibacillus TaxID=185978 RepID=UPI001AE72291|nr:MULTISPECIES: ABC transporter substrate-binding protein [unclassified Paenibacillus]MBP1155043.1 putative ABC transport system substrate-binding protein [Paenibacillus sp. PvP091]MBP1169574.1 putative ABC transport system substrate-binding protein [Paenibacillus sp. PvR098]MBP2440602.1 putative ABC transport system substrate-binding protein [Paenibacillus sp. PvP052]